MNIRIPLAGESRWLSYTLTIHLNRGRFTMKKLVRLGATYKLVEDLFVLTRVALRVGGKYSLQITNTATGEQGSKVNEITRVDYDEHSYPLFDADEVDLKLALYCRGYKLLDAKHKQPKEYIWTGDQVWFEGYDGKYLVSIVGDRKISFISLNTGNRLCEPKFLSNLYTDYPTNPNGRVGFTEKELQELADECIRGVFRNED
jgi:hypothetical protein